MEKIVRHPQFDAKRLSDDIAVMITSRVVGEPFPYSAFLVVFLSHNIVFFSFPQHCFPLQTCSTPMCLLPASHPAKNSLIMSSATGREQGSAFIFHAYIIKVDQSQYHCVQYVSVFSNEHEQVYILGAGRLAGARMSSPDLSNSSNTRLAQYNVNMST